MRATTHTRLDADQIIESAEYATSAWELCDEGLRRRLHAFVDCANRSAGRDESRMARAHAQLLAMMHRRLRLEADLRRVPAMTQEEISRPIFIIGYSRTGTSLRSYIPLGVNILCNASTMASFHRSIPSASV